MYLCGTMIGEVFKDSVRRQLYEVKDHDVGLLRSVRACGVQIYSPPYSYPIPSWVGTSPQPLDRLVAPTPCMMAVTRASTAQVVAC